MSERPNFYINPDSGTKYPIGDLFGYPDSLIIARTSAAYHLGIELLDQGRDYSTVLDYGSGRGHGLVAIRERLGSDRIVSVDTHAPYLEAQRLALAAGESATPYEFLNLSKPPLPFANETFDAIFFMHVIEHIDNPEQLLGEMHRVLQKDGTLLMATPNLKNLVAPNPTDEHVYSEGELSALLDSVGFEPVEHSVVPDENAWKVHSRKKLLARIPGARTLRDRIPQVILDRGVLRRGISADPLTFRNFDLSTGLDDKTIDILVVAKKSPNE